MRCVLAAVVALFVAASALTFTTSPASAVEGSVPTKQWLKDLNTCSGEVANRQTNTRITRQGAAGPRLRAFVQVKEAADDLYCVRVVANSKSALAGWKFSSRANAETADHSSGWVLFDHAHRGTWTPVRTRKNLLVSGAITLERVTVNGKVIARYASEVRTFS